MGGLQTFLWAKLKSGVNRAKVVASTTPRSLKISRPGALQRSARQLNDNFMLNDNTPIKLR